MSTYTQLIYHFVYSTKNRERSLASANRSRLYEYIWGILKNKKCHPYRINGIEDHIHIATHVHPSVPVSDLVKDVKLACTSMIKEHSLFDKFNGWQDGYAAFTVSFQDKNRLIEYLKNQEEHHKMVPFKEELMDLLNEHGIEFDEKYLL